MPSLIDTRPGLLGETALNRLRRMSAGCTALLTNSRTHFWMNCVLSWTECHPEIVLRIAGAGPGTR